MKTRYFVAYVLAGIIFEYLLRLAFVGYPVIIVPELIIFLTVLNLDDKNILTKFIYSSILYDLWASSQFGSIILPMLLVFLILYFIGRVSYIGGKTVLRASVSNIITLILLFDLLFLIYYAASGLLAKILLSFPAGISQIWELPALSNIIQISIMASIVFLVLYFFHKCLSKLKLLKI